MMPSRLPRPPVPLASARGFTTLELLMATALLLVITGAIAALVQPLGDVMDRSIGRSDLTGGARAVLDRLSTELREAGSPAAAAIDRARPARVLSAVTVLSDLAAPTPANPGRAVRILRVPLQARQGIASAPVAAGSTWVSLETTHACTSIGPACGFLPGMTALLHDDTRAVIVTVQSVVAPETIRLASPAPTAFPAGAVLAEVVVTEFGLRPDPDGSFRLVRVRQGLDQPVIQQVVDFTVETVGPDPTRVHQVDVRLRLEAAAHHRGPASWWFRRAGTSASERTWIPDVEWHTRVALRQVEP
jgi:hypothetical protein